MRGLSLVTLLVVAIFFCTTTTEAAKCRGRYMEMRGGDGFVTRGGCRGLDSQIQEEYWTTIGFDGALRDGRTTDDFLVFPQNENNGHLQRNSFIGYWITRSKYGENVHYEAFGHAFIKPDGKVCGWFVGSQKEVVEVCGGFRVLSRSRHNPHQPIPFEWVQGEQYRNRDVLGFHHHKIAKYEANGDEVFFGDADVKGKKFNGVSIGNEQRVEVDTPETFHRKVWLLRKKSTQPPSDNRIPLNIINEPKRREDLNIYKDPHHEERIANMRFYPYYDQYGRPSSSQLDASRPAYDSSGRRLPFDGNTSQISNIYQKYPYDSQQQPQQQQQQQQQPQQQQQLQPVPRGHPGYEEWLRNQYRIRGIVPRGYNDDQGNYQQVSNNRVDGRVYEQPSYVLQPSSEAKESGSSPNNQVYYEGSRSSQSGNSENSQNLGETYYSVNPGTPVDSIGSQTRVDGEFRQAKVPAAEETEVVVPGNQQQQQQQHVRFIRYHPPTVIRDKKGNLYERRVENGKVHYIDASGNEVKTKIDDSAIDMKIERILENRRRQEENMRNLVDNSDSESGNDGSDPISAAEIARQG